jgi:putative flippase GtrA
MKVFLNPIAYIDKKTFSSYVIIGFSTVIIYYTAFVILWRYFDLHYAVALTIAYLISTTFNFNANRSFTFSYHEGKWYFQLMKYLVVALVNYLVSLFVAHIVVEYLLLSPYIGGIVAIGMTVIMGYLLSKFWIYSPGTCSLHT